MGSSSGGKTGSEADYVGNSGGTGKTKAAMMAKKVLVWKVAGVSATWQPLADGWCAGPDEAGPHEAGPDGALTSGGDGDGGDCA